MRHQEGNHWCDKLGPVAHRPVKLVSRRNVEECELQKHKNVISRLNENSGQNVKTQNTDGNVDAKARIFRSQKGKGSLSEIGLQFPCATSWHKVSGGTEEA